MKAFSLILLSTALLFSACSTPQEPLQPENETLRIHERAWSDPELPGFHGAVLAARNYDLSECSQCHGADLDGGLVRVSCRKCHTSYPHPEGWAQDNRPVHGVFLQAQGYPLDSCKTCHGADYAELKQGKTCLTCHNQQNGPEACNTCHGRFEADGTDLRNAAPPAGLREEGSGESRAVGAHQAHLALADSASARSYCAECHTIPASVNSPGHLDADGRAEVEFKGPLAATPSSDGRLQPLGVYDYATGSCANTYCHGNWQLNKSTAVFGFIYAADSMAGRNATPVWTDPATSACGTCHTLPPDGHKVAAPQACVTCHASVVDATGRIIDTGKHVNGKINALARESDMR